MEMDEDDLRDAFRGMHEDDLIDLLFQAYDERDAAIDESKHSAAMKYKKRLRKALEQRDACWEALKECAPYAAQGVWSHVDSHASRAMELFGRANALIHDQEPIDD